MSRRRRGATRVTTISGRSPLTGRGSVCIHCSVATSIQSHTKLSCNKHTITKYQAAAQTWGAVYCSVATSILQSMAIIVIRPWLRDVALCVQQYVRRCGDVEVLWQQNSRIAQCFAGNPPKPISPPMSTPYQGLPRQYRVLLPWLLWHCLLW